ncbi:MAG: cobaltochelatase subunit CobN [Methanobrevibacter sp.]|nr:cobaltochelatase subunit CobN [Methanobrevibacter sp.]
MGCVIIRRINTNFIITLSLVLLVLLSVSSISAADNQNITDTYDENVAIDDVGDIHSSDVPKLGAGSDSVLSVSNNVVTINVYDSYNETSKNWDQTGVPVNGATVEVFDSSDNKVKTVSTNAKGTVTIKNLDTGKYSIKVSYSTYEPIINEIDFNKGNIIKNDVVFVPDILLLVSYNDHSEKVDLLMNMSRRVAYISTTDVDKSREWLANYAKFIHVDMFAETGYTIFDSQYLAKLLAQSPANKNYNVAYTFGVYSDDILNNVKLHVVGANSTNNTFHTIENTYIGSYFQARDIENYDILSTNMKNYLDYVYYLINPLKYEDPTLNVENAPLMSPESGFYHPDLGIYSICPEKELINQWIINNPGYTADDGSLRWMVDEYPVWLMDNLDPSSLFTKFESDYVNKFNPDASFIGIASYYCGGDLVDALIRTFEANGRPAFNIFKFSTQPSMASILTKVNNATTVGISSIISLYSWSLSYANGSAESELSEIDLTILKGVNEISEYSYNSVLGPQSEWTYAVTYPSFEGVFSPVILSYVDSNGDTHVIQSGVDKMVQLSCGWANLKDLNNSDKTIAIVLYNYPPGKAEIGASYLDVFSSTYELLIKLEENGYDVGGHIEDLISLANLTSIIFDMNNKGSWASGLLNKYVEDNWDSLMEHHQLINYDDFTDLIDDLPEHLYKQMVDKWGNGLGPAMVYNKTDEHYIVIPGVWFGKVFITFQPSRGWEEAVNYHDLELPPHQQYVAFYEWLDKTADVDAIINMGTHGTLEWLPGTNLGAVEGDWTFELQKIPTIYPYIVSNPGEAMVARDRIAALMITHMTPAMVYADLYGNYTVLADYITHYKDQIKLNVTSNANEYKAKILELAPKLFRSMYADETFDEYIDALHMELENMENDHITYGLHTLGYVMTGQALVEEVITVTTSQTKIYDEILHFLYNSEYINSNTYAVDKARSILNEYMMAQASGQSIVNLNRKYGFDDDASIGEVAKLLFAQATSDNKTYIKDFSNLDFYDDIDNSLDYINEKNAIKAFLREYVTRLVNGSSVEELNKEYGISEGSDLYKSTLYAAQVIVNIQNNNEWEAIFDALSGNYLKAGLFADPAYGNSIPTGYDGYASDPTKMPSQAAYESAVKIVDLLLANYYEKHGKWPELTALILWGTEISRTEGIGVAEFLYFLGCKPTWAKNGNVNGVELIPLEDLTVELNNGTVVNRPRIDVFASMVTSNKDWINWMVTAVRLAAFAEGENETDNFVKKHYAEEPSLDRLFGLPGNILEGTGMSNLIPNTADWNILTIHDVGADKYLSKVSFAWSINEKGNVDVKNNRKVYEYLLTKTDLITQNFDSTWRFLDSDDYYDWFGGLYNAAVVLKKRAGIDERPDTAFVDIRDKNNYYSRTYEEELEFEIRTKILNPKYYTPLINTAAGMNAYAAQYQNLFAGVIIGNVQISKSTYDQMADTLLDIASTVNSAETSAGLQSSLAWMIYLYQTGMWEADASTVQRLVDEYINQVLKYGVACCHHTCKNLEFNMKIIQMSSLTPAQKQRFAEILSQATNTDPLYQSESQSGSNQGASGSSGENGQQGSYTLVNGTDNQESSQSGGETAFGDQASSSQATAKQASTSQDASSSSSPSDQSNGKAYELSDSSASKSAAATESSMPIFVIMAILLLIAIFLVGYLRNDEDEDDY